MQLINKPFKIGAMDRETELNVSDLRAGGICIVDTMRLFSGATSDLSVATAFNNICECG
jgi:hypothetical protein